MSKATEQLEIPKGYIRVIYGKVQKGDLYFGIKECQWKPMPEDFQWTILEGVPMVARPIKP
jgi:hypothetical protein